MRHTVCVKYVTLQPVHCPGPGRHVSLKGSPASRAEPPVHLRASRPCSPSVYAGSVSAASQEGDRVRVVRTTVYAREGTPPADSNHWAPPPAPEQARLPGPSASPALPPTLSRTLLRPGRCERRQ